MLYHRGKSNVSKRRLAIEPEVKKANQPVKILPKKGLKTKPIKGTTTKAKLKVKKMKGEY